MICHPICARWPLWNHSAVWNRQRSGRVADLTHFHHRRAADFRAHRQTDMHTHTHKHRRHTWPERNAYRKQQHMHSHHVPQTKFTTGDGAQNEIDIEDENRVRFDMRRHCDYLFYGFIRARKRTTATHVWQPHSVRCVTHSMRLFGWCCNNLWCETVSSWWTCWMGYSAGHICQSFGRHFGTWLWHLLLLCDEHTCLLFVDTYFLLLYRIVIMPSNMINIDYCILMSFPIFRYVASPISPYKIIKHFFMVETKSRKHEIHLQKKGIDWTGINVMEEFENNYDERSFIALRGIHI